MAKMNFIKEMKRHAGIISLNEEEKGNAGEQYWNKRKEERAVKPLTNKRGSTLEKHIKVQGADKKVVKAMALSSIPENFKRDFVRLNDSKLIGMLRTSLSSNKITKKKFADTFFALGDTSKKNKRNFDSDQLERTYDFIMGKKVLPDETLDLPNVDRKDMGIKATIGDVLRLAKEFENRLDEKGTSTEDLKKLPKGLS